MAKNRFGVPIKTKPSKPKKEAAPGAPEPAKDDVMPKLSMLSGVIDKMTEMEKTSHAIEFKKEMTPHLIEAATKVLACDLIDGPAKVRAAADEFLIDMFKLFGVSKPDPAPVINPETVTKADDEVVPTAPSINLDDEGDETKSDE